MCYEEQGLILVVDDNLYSQGLLRAILSRNGYEIALLEDGEQAIEFIRNERVPTLILLDIMMPGMDGYEVCLRLKRDDISSPIPVIFLTAKTDTASVVRGFECGGVDYVVKPFRVAELLARVRTHIGLANANAMVKKLRGIIVTCSQCKAIKNTAGEWIPWESFMDANTHAQLSHGMCPTCLEKLYPEISARIANAELKRPPDSTD